MVFFDWPEEFDHLDPWDDIDDDDWDDEEDDLFLEEADIAYDTWRDEHAEHRR